MEQAAEKKNDNTMRRLARLAAVQGLYQLALMPEPADALIRRFRENPGVLLQEEQAVIAVDVELFGQIVSGVSKNTESLDAMIDAAVDARLSAKRMEPLLKAIFRSGVFELLNHGSVASGVIINDYVEVTHGFFSDKEPGLVNAILDKLAKTLRR